MTRSRPGTFLDVRAGGTFLRLAAVRLDSDRNRRGNAARLNRSAGAYRISMR